MYITETLKRHSTHHVVVSFSSRLGFDQLLERRAPAAHAAMHHHVVQDLFLQRYGVGINATEDAGDEGHVVGGVCSCREPGLVVREFLFGEIKRMRKEVVVTRLL